MISTLTPSITAAISASSFALLTVLILLSLLIHKEAVSAGQEERWQQLSRALTVLIIPLGLAFLAITVVELLKVF
jgi:sulfite exporter TauE/SafE